jgi:hypothetical protein
MRFTNKKKIKKIGSSLTLEPPQAENGQKEMPYALRDVIRSQLQAKNACLLTWAGLGRQLFMFITTKKTF